MTSRSKRGIMAKRKRAEQRPSGPEALDPHAVAGLVARLLTGRRAWSYTVTVLEQISPARKQKATPRDENRLQRALVRHFGGVT